MPARSHSKLPHRRGGRRWASAVAFMACVGVLAAGAYAVLRGDLLSTAIALFSPGADVELAATPQPRIASNTGAPADAPLAAM